MKETARQKNDVVTKIWKDAAEENNYKTYYKRTGSCCWKKCQSACCRFTHIEKVNKKAKQEWQRMAACHQTVGVQVRSSGGYDHYVVPRLCPHISLDGQCDLHGKKIQPRVCRFFPMGPDDGTYVAVKHLCGYKFEELKNLKYESKKKREIKLQEE